MIFPAQIEILERVEMEKSEKRRKRCSPWKLRGSVRREESEEGFREF